MENSTPVLIEVEPGAVRDQLVAALSMAGATPITSGSAPVRFADSRAGEAPVATDVRLWTEGRYRRQDNPFAAANVRHVLGAAGELDRDGVRAILGQIQNADAMALENVVNEESRTETRLAQSSDSKAELLAAATEFFTNAGAAPHVVDAMLLALDELYTNAVYNAPLEGGVRLHASKARTETVCSPRPVMVRFAADGNNVAIAVRDMYGTLDPEVAMSYLRRCHSAKQAAPEEKAGGAGLGLYMLLQSASRLVLNISPGDFTEVIVVRKLGERRRAFSEGAPTFHLCVEGGAT